MKSLKMRILVSAAAIFLFAVLFACQKAPLVIEYVKYDNDAAVPRISPADAKKDFDAGNAVFIDSRGDGAFNAEHLPGALNIAFGSTEEKFSQLPKGKKIIVYCS